jgi:hypothetical protein
MRSAILLLAIFAATALAGCGSYYSCNSCASTAGCGWAQDLGQCLPGNSMGPTNGQSSYNWDYTTSDCPNSGYVFFSWSSWAMWLVVCGICIFFFSLCACCNYRRRRNTVIVTETVYTPDGAYFVQQQAYAPVYQQQPAYGSVYVAQPVY